MWKDIKGLFVIEEEAGRGAKPAGGKVKTPAPTPPASVGTSPAPAAAPLEMSGVVNDKFVKVLMEAMEKANLPGFDYLEYKKSLQNLKAMNFTDDVRFKTAFAAAQSMGVTPTDLTKSAQHYLATLAKEEGKFKQALAKQRTAQVSDKEARLQSLDADIKQQEAKIKELQAAIEKTRAEQQKLRTTIQKSTGKLTKTSKDFETTYRVIVESITSDVQKMEQYLK